jgi:DNA-binding SARP family transcriptional activator
VPPDELAEVFWPAAGRAGLNNVRHFIHALRDRLEPARLAREPSSFVVTRDGGYALDLERIDLDTQEFEQLIAAGGSSLEQAVALYEGELLADDPYADWALAERDRLRGLAHTALRTLATACLERKDTPGAAVHLDVLAQIEPFDSAVHRDVIELCLSRGRRSEAVRRYQAFRTRVVMSFGEEPEFTLGELLDDRP